MSAGQRVALGVEYRGSAYHGWERQRHASSVQAVLEAALGRVAAGRVGTVCAGRTDAGVHALGQVVHFDSPALRPAHAWVLGTNTYLPDDVSVTWASAVGEDFHARFSAEARCYRYVVVNRASRPALLHGLATWVHRPLCAQRMHSAAQALVGAHDFSAFRASGCQAHTARRRVEHCRVWRRDTLVFLDVCANAFLQHMVRNIAGVLIAIGSGERAVDWAAEVLATRRRTQGGVTAAPDGLYLMSVRYPPGAGLPEVPPPQSIW